MNEQVLLEYKATVDVADKGGSTPLCRASCLGNVDAAKVNRILIRFPDTSVSDASGSRGLKDSEG